MKVKCVICDKIEALADETLLAKRLRNRPIHTYLCDECNLRIKVSTEARIATGKFKLYSDKANEDDWL